MKLAAALLAIAVAGSASAAGWRSLRLDGSTEAGLAASVAEFEERLPPARYQVFLLALKDVWEQGTKNAEAAQAASTDNDYLRQIDGLQYEQVITLTDPTGDTAKTRMRAAVARLNGPVRVASFSSGNSSPPPGIPRGMTPQQISTGSWRGECGCSN